MGDRFEVPIRIHLDQPGLWRSPLIGTEGLAVRSALEPELKKRAVRVMSLGLNSVLGASGKYGLVGLSSPALMLMAEPLLADGATLRDKGRPRAVVGGCVNAPQLLSVGHRL